MIKKILDSNLVSAIIALVGIIVSLKWSTGETTKRMEHALKVYESELNRKVYVSSKRADIEFEIFQKLGKNCGEILQLMQRLYPDKLSTHQINYSERGCRTKKLVRYPFFYVKLVYNLKKNKSQDSKNLGFMVKY